MILIDSQQILIANIMRNMKDGKLPDEALVRHMVLQSIKAYKNQFSNDYGQVVLCYDSIRSWRKDIFPLYKAHRKDDRDASSVDWSQVHSIFDKFKKEMKDNLPYVVIDVAGAEADDIIGVLAKEYSIHEPIIIISSDKDFLQLQCFPNVSQFSPITKKFVKTDNPVDFLKEHIIRGDKGDGIPNILSADDSLYRKEKQTAISSEKVNKWLSLDYKLFCETEKIKHGFKRNQRLIDLNFIPEDIHKSIIETYRSYKRNPREKLIKYFMENNLQQLTQSIGDF